MNQQMKLSVAVLLLVMSTAVGANEKLLKECKALQKEITRLESLRSDGGSARKMDNWKRQIHDKQDDYSKLYCRQYRFQLDKR